MFFFFNDTATTEIYTLSLHDALPISRPRSSPSPACAPAPSPWRARRARPDRSSSPSPRRRGSSLLFHSLLYQLTDQDRKSTRLNSSHLVISYAVFCLKKNI